ncbi:MAG: CRISPR system precrRNA processing endoribonuclease RAMP protein Cas6 [Nitrososphaeria archaeon]|nr:CRISPR system precrRNA processing endoribonuclease RAMP protein Cas6 [Nitrososphaeria archaeon]
MQAFTINLELPFTSILLELYSQEDIHFQSFSGYSTRGLFYNIVKSFDEEYASQLHNSRLLAPFSVSPIYAIRGNSFHPCFERAGKGILRINFTLLENRLNEIFMKFIQEGLGENGLPIGKTKIIPNSISFQQLDYEKFYKNSVEIHSFKVSFMTPTYFRQTPRDIMKRYGKQFDKKITVSPYRFLPLPDPVLFFKSVARIWRKFSNYNLNLQEFIEWLEVGGIAISGYPKGIRTHIVHEHPTTKKWCVGFTGTVHFSIVKDIYNSEKARIADTLLKFAEYTNVGGGRTAGLGMIKYYPKKR